MRHSQLRHLPPAPAPVLASLFLGLFFAGAGGQELPWLKGGKASLDFAPIFWTWDHRYGVGADGSSLVQPLGASLTADPLGSTVIPMLSPLETSLGEALDNPLYRVRLGASQAVLDQARLVFPFRFAVGVTDWLTVGAMVPLVRPRMEIALTLDADSLNADVGVSPQITSQGQVSQFLSQFQAVLNGAQQTHPGDPSVTEAQTYLSALRQAYEQATFFPIEGSATGATLQARLDRLRSNLAQLGIGGIPATLPLAQGYLDREALGEFVTRSPGGLGAFPLQDWTTLWSLGDIELTAAVRLLSGGFEPDSLGQLPWLQYQLGGGALVRLGTGQQADPNRFFEQSAGDGQNDFEGNVFGLVNLGSRIGAWGILRYGVQTQGQVTRRIATPSQALPSADRQARLNWTPGNYVELDINPRLYLNSAMSFGVRYHHWSKQADSYELAGSPSGEPSAASLPPASLLDLETKQNLRELGFTATYSTLEAFDQGEASMPFYIRATYFRPVGGSGGQTPKGGRFQAGITIYRTLWGRKPQEEPASEPPGS